MLKIDRDVKAVLEFMQMNIEASKLIAAADCLPQVAKLLWQHYPQQSFLLASLVLESLSTPCERQLTAIE